MWLAAVLLVGALTGSVVSAQDPEGQETCLREMDDPEPVISACTRAIQAGLAESPLAAVYFRRGIAYEKKGDHEQAIRDFSQAIQLAPDSANAFLNRGVAHREKGDVDRAIEDFAQAIRLRPTSALAWRGRAELYLDYNEDYERAVADYGEAVRLEPTNPGYANGLGVAYANEGEYKRAIDEFSRAIRLDPNGSYYYYNRGMAYFDQGEFVEAVPDFTKSAELLSDSLYRKLFIYLAQTRSGQNGLETLARSTQSANLERWPGPVVSLYLGKLAFDALTLPNNPGQICEAHFYIGEYLLIKGRGAEAIGHFTESLAKCAHNHYEYWSARAELRGMRNRK